MRAFNGDTKPTFLWCPCGRAIITEAVNLRGMHSEVFYSELYIDPVKQKDYGSYDVTVSNGLANGIQFPVILMEKGKLQTTSPLHITYNVCF